MGGGVRILVVEDDAAMLRGLRDMLVSMGYDVVTAAEGETGLDLAISAEPALILLDVMLPKVNGYEICRSLRERGLRMPIIILTAKAQEEDLVLGLNLGADDYVTKPFRRAELAARIRAALRRVTQDQHGPVAWGDCELHPKSRRLFRKGRLVDLTAREYALLAYFVSRRGSALARDTILDAVWGTSVFVTPRSIDRCVATLRAKIEPDPHYPSWIRTVRDIGYRFDPDDASA